MEFFNKWAPWFMSCLMDDFNLSVLDAAAVIGNAGHESGGFKSLQEKKPLVKGSRGGYGIMQWTGPRRKLYEAYCKRNGKNPADMQTNYAFLYVELNGAEGKDGKVLARVRAAKTLDQKTEVFMKEFLRPGIPHLESRKKWALRALHAFEAEYEKPIPQPVPDREPIEVPQKKRTLWEVILGLLVAFIRGGK